MYKLRRKLLSQNFLHDHDLVSKLVRNSSIGKKDLVLEIGPGKGIITEQLVKQAKSVQAIEIDPFLFSFLQKKFSKVMNLTFKQQDFLDSDLPQAQYKVFANIPFSIEGRAIRKLLEAQNPPEDCYLVVRKEFAERLMNPKNLFATKHTPWFQFSIAYYFKGSDFIPKTRINAILLRFSKRKDPFVSWEEREKYQDFVEKGFGQGLPVVGKLKGLFDYLALLKAINEVGLSKGTKPGKVSLDQWVRLYSRLKKS